MEETEVQALPEIAAPPLLPAAGNLPYFANFEAMPPNVLELSVEAQQLKTISGDRWAYFDLIYQV